MEISLSVTWRMEKGEKKKRWKGDENDEEKGNAHLVK
jgi:hypothetical protein